MNNHVPLANETILQNRYEVKGKLGRGGMGVVYEAVDLTLSARVALKETFADDDVLRASFKREAKLLANLSHEAFPRVKDYFIENERHFLVMELIEGKDFDELLKRQKEPFSVEDVIDWADQLLDALDYLHEQGIIHRDIKPANLKQTSRGKMKLLDFGIAKGAIGDITTVKKSGIYAFSLHYAPLEQILQIEKRTDARSDLYALGATLYHLLTNRLPEESTSRASAVWLGIGDNLLPIRSLNPQVPAHFARILEKALALEPENRFDSALEMQIALRHAGYAPPRQKRKLAAKSGIAVKNPVYENAGAVISNIRPILSNKTVVEQKNSGKTIFPPAIDDRRARDHRKAQARQERVKFEFENHVEERETQRKTKLFSIVSATLIILVAAFGLTAFMQKPPTDAAARSNVNSPANANLSGTIVTGKNSGRAKK